jgi:hypothetical protein
VTDAMHTRLVQAPVFVISTLRSGSTLLRVMLDSHPRVRAPHEMHLRAIKVHVPNAFAGPAMAAMALDERELEHLLWDRVLHLELQRSGKDVIVDKTPGNAFEWQRLAECWPDARFLFLLRHPAAIVDSLARAWPGRSRGRVEHQVLGYAQGVEDARKVLPGHVLSYEALVTHPGATTRSVCAFLGISWDARMLDYGDGDHGPFTVGLGDWGEKIRSGRVQPARPLPIQPLTSPQLLELVKTWGYEEGRPR